MNILTFIRNGKKEFENVCFRIRDTGVELHYKSEILVSKSEWDNKNNSLKKLNTRIDDEKKKRYQLLDNQIKDRIKLLRDIFITYDRPDLIKSKDLCNDIDKKLHPEKYEEIKKPLTLFEYISNFIDDAPTRKDKNTGRLLSPNNIQQYKATEKHLIEFAKIENKKDYLLSEINKDFYNRFVDYLQSEIPELDMKGSPKYDDEGNEILIKEKFTQNTVGKHIRILKLMLRAGKIAEVDISDFHVFTEEIDTIYLDEKELQQLKDTDLTKTSYLDRVRDYFLILAWTGCRFSDLDKVAKTDIQDNFITFRQQKTNNKVTIPLHPVVLEILEKYNFELPEKISNQKFNEYIKEVAKLAQVGSVHSFTRTVGGVLKAEKAPKYELISSHTGRRSFCTNMYKRGLPTLMIMSISGHRTEKSFLKYIKIKPEEHAKMMAEKWKEIYK